MTYYSLVGDTSSMRCLCIFIRVCDMTHSCVWHDSFVCVTWLIHVCVTQLIHVCNMNHFSFVGYTSSVCCLCIRKRSCHTHVSLCPKETCLGHKDTCVWHDLVICVTWLIHLCLFMCVLWHVHVCDMTHSSLLIHVCVVTRSCVWHVRWLCTAWHNARFSFLRVVNPRGSWINNTQQWKHSQAPWITKRAHHELTS